MDAINAGYVSGITADGLTQTVSGAAENAETPFSFASEGGITFNRAGTYTFVMSETAGNLDGMTYDTHDCTVTVKVGLDTDKGELTASVNYGTYQDRAGNSFVNTYEASMNYGADGAGGINVSKTLTGRDMLANEFSFSIEGVDSDTVTAEDAKAKISTDDMNFTNDSAAADGTADVMAKFQSVTFDQNDKNKVFTYKVRENPGDLANVGYDQNVYTVAIAVHDNGDGDMYAITTVTDVAGEEVASADSRTDQPVTVAFSNTYTPDSVTTNQDTDSTLKVTKQVTGAPTDADFNFTLTLVYGDGSAVSGLDQNGHATVTDHFNDGDTKEATFGEISFSKAGTYVFQASEDEGLDEVTDPNGWTYATNVPRIRVVVTDKNPAHDTDPNQPLYDGKLYIESVTNNNPTFTNSYDHGEITLAGDTALQVKKAVTGWTTDVEFDFTLAPVTEGADANWDTVEYDDSALKASVGGFISADDLGAENAKPASFGSIKFTEPGTYQFTVTEDQANDDAGDPAGWTYDKAVHRITVTVSETNAADQYDGQLHATVTTDMATNTDPVLFTNSYTGNGELDGATDLVVTKKLVGRDWAADDEFTFSIAAGDEATQQAIDAGNVTLPDSPIAINAKTENHAKAFGNIQFSGSGEHTYTFIVKENVPEGANADNGWTLDNLTYDNSSKKVTVHVTDNGSGKLTAEVVEESSDELSFTNVYYNPGDAKESTDTTPETGVQVGDVLTYTIDWANNAVNDNGEPVAADVTVTDSLPVGLVYVGVPEDATEPTSVSDDGKTIVWDLGTQAVGATGTLTFNARVTEDAAPAGAVDNQATVKVGDNEHKTNVTHDEIGTGNLTISKKVELVPDQGTEIDTAKLFEFTLSLNDASGNDLAANYTISGAYDAEGKQLTSVTNDSKFYLHHGDEATISALPDGAVAVVDETDILNDGYSQRRPANGVPGTDGIEAGKTANISFVNLYNADSSTVEEGTDKAFNLTKQFTGRDGNVWLEGDQFSFTLTAGSAYTLDDAADGKLDTPLTGVTVPMPADATDGAKTIVVGDDEEANADGIAPIDFGKIEYARTGVYTYTVQEVGFDGTLGTGGYADGITYDGRTVTITVTVRDYGQGDLVAAVEKRDEAVSATDDAAAVSFSNTYESTFDYGMNGNGGLDITKTLDNHDMTAGQFAFTVTPANQNAIDKMGSDAVRLTSPAADAGDVAIVSGNPLNNLTFDRADSGEEFVFTIDETTESGQGYTCDPEVYTVTITPTDNGNGTMSVRTVVTNQADETVQDVTSTEDAPQKATIDFVNTYEPGVVIVGGDGQAQIVATKALQNDDVASHIGEFNFRVTSGDVTVAQGSNTADGGATVVFNSITYTASELYKAAHGGSEVIGTATPGTDENGNETWTFVYNVTEDPIADGSGVSYVDGGGSVTVVVTDPGDGDLTVAVSYPNDGNGIAFTNAYGAGETAQLTLNGSKVLNGVNGAVPPALGNDMFSFTITGVDENGNSAPLPETTVKGNVGSGVSFGPITYKMEDVFGANASATDASSGEADANDGIDVQTIGRSKVYTYTITESPDKTLPGVTNDTVAKIVTVTVTDNGDGTLSAKVTGVADGAATNMDFTFTNTYTVTPEKSTPTGDGGLTFTKKLDTQSGTRQLAAGDFTFQLTDDEGAVVADGTNDANGKVAMSAIEFTHAGDYSYTLTEVVPEGATPNADGSYTFEGVTYLPAQYAVTAHVVDNHNGTLTVTWDMTNADGDAVTTAQFVNVYNVDPTTVTFGAAKALEGREIAEGEFEFELKDAQGKVVATATNDADGAVTFEPQTFGDAGTYEFTISEVQGDAEGVTYDTTVYDVVLTLTDNDKGGLEVTELTYNGAAALPVFTNTYTEPPAPVEPDEVIPATGDAAVAAVAATVAIGGTLVAAGYVTSKKRGE